MKNIRCFTFAGLMLLAGSYKAFAGDATTDSTGLAGDQFSLQGALDLFKNSTSLEDFEKKLNTESNGVNNLDLDGDGQIDYVRVLDNMKDNAHAIVLQVAVTQTEAQDVAVIELEKNGNESATLQIVGDEQLYGDTAIVEPFDEKEMINDKSGKGPGVNVNMHFGIWVNVWFWPCVRFVYAPAYVVWVSPWYWHHYPMWWSPWHPHPWYWHHQHCMGYYGFYRPVYVHRTMVAYGVYRPIHRTSVVVVNRNKVAYNNYHAQHNGNPHGNYNGPHTNNGGSNGKTYQQGQHGNGGMGGTQGPRGNGNKQGGNHGGGMNGPKGGGHNGGGGNMHGGNHGGGQMNGGNHGGGHMNGGGGHGGGGGHRSEERRVGK